MVIGGGEIYALAIDHADHMHLTWIDTDAVSADTWFPRFEQADWNITREQFHPVDDKHALPFRFADYTRLTSSQV